MRRRIVIGTATIAALDTSPSGVVSGDRPVVLLVPGYTGSKEDFAPIMKPAADSGYRLISVDQRGQFESSWSDDPVDYRIDRLAQDIIEIARQLGARANRIHLVGHSFGGLVSRAAVIAAPTAFRSLTLIGSGPSAIHGQRGVMLQRGEPLLIEQGPEAVWAFMASNAADDSKYGATSDQLPFLRRRFLSNDPAGLLEMGRELRSATDRTDQLRETGVPLLVVHGVDDDAWPGRDQARMAEALGARYVVIPDAIHSPAVENPTDTVAALIEFWDSVV